MLKIELKEKIDESITFRLPTGLKIKLPGAVKQVGESVKFTDGHAIGDLYRQLTEMFVDGTLDIFTKGANELFKLMSIVKPSKAQMAKVNMKAIKDLGGKL